MIWSETELNLFHSVLYYDRKQTHMLFAATRKKYGSSSNNTSHDRRIFRTGDFLNQVQEIAARIEDPEHSVLYTSVNPRDCFKAGKLLMKFMMDTFETQDGWNNLSSKWKSMMQKSALRHEDNLEWVTIDYDRPDHKQKKEEDPHCLDVEKLLKDNHFQYLTIETKNGFHFLVHNLNLSRSKRQILYHDISQLPGVDSVRGDIFCPIPGTLQAGFPVRFIPHNDIAASYQSREEIKQS